jgi:hypothetical protein
MRLLRLPGLLWAKEYLLCNGQLHRALAVKREQRSAVNGFVHEARTKLRAARVLTAAGLPSTALPFYRATLVLLARAELAVSGPAGAGDLAPNEALACASECSHGGCAQGTFALAMELTSVKADEHDDIPLSESYARAEELDALALRLFDLVLVRTPAEVKLLRTGRVTVLAVAVLALPLGAAAWSRVPTNLALNKPVTASSRSQETNPEGVVDGRLYGRFGFHSATEDRPWVVIDLGQVHHITDAQVFGRHDCCFTQSVPLAFEVSVDGKEYRSLATKKDAFVSLEPWIIADTNASARYVRLRTINKKSNLVLTEVIVNGRPL